MELTANNLNNNKTPHVVTRTTYYITRPIGEITPYISTTIIYLLFIIFYNFIENILYLKHNLQNKHKLQTIKYANNQCCYSLDYETKSSIYPVNQVTQTQEYFKQDTNHNQYNIKRTTDIFATTKNTEESSSGCYIYCRQRIYINYRVQEYSCVAARDKYINIHKLLNGSLVIVKVQVAIAIITRSEVIVFTRKPVI